MNIKTLDQIKKEYYGEVGTAERDRIERELEALRIGFQNPFGEGEKSHDTRGIGQED